MKHLHIIPEEKFTLSFISFINNFFESKQHLFLIYNLKDEKKYEAFNNNVVRKFEWIKMIVGANFSSKIYIHYFGSYTVIFLFLQPWLLKKCNWVIWGGDLYYYQKPKITIKEKLYEFMRAFCIKRFGGLITYVRGDYELAKKWYRAKGTYYECIMYPSNLYKELEVKRIDNQDKIYIQLGNSADPSNEHLKILERLEQYKNEKIEIICPLSYGDKEYAFKIKKIGEEKFGNKFVALMDFMQFEKYLEILGKIDIAIFNHNRQQAMGNIITLLGLGKKVFIREGITTEELFDEKHIKVYNNKNLDISRIDDKVKIENEKRVEDCFSEATLYNQWRNIFEGEKYSEN